LVVFGSAIQRIRSLPGWPAESGPAESRQSMRLSRLVVLLVLLCPQLSNAQTPARDSAGPDSAGRPGSELDTVAIHAHARNDRAYMVRRISSATRTDLPLRDIPQAITVIPKALLADQSVQSMSEIARFIPGVTFGQGEGHRDAPTIRGIASTADFYLDGVRDDAQYLRDIYSTERVEALKGSSAMTFGRGGGGGVINRVTKSADWRRIHSVAVEGGSFDHRRTTLDVGDGLSSSFSARLNAMAESSGSFRAATTLARRGFSPAATVLVGGNVLRAGYEYLVDDRTVDRGIPSFQGKPAPAPIRTFFGDPAASRSSLDAHSASFLVERESAGVFTLRNRTHFAGYDKSYQNVLPGAVTADGSQVTISGYRSRHDRTNLFNQTELVFSSRKTSLQHTLLIGAEVGRQTTDNYRETGYFGADNTSVKVPFSSPTIQSGVTFRQSASDADNNVRAAVASVYAQEQLTLGAHLQAIAGVRGEQFTINFRDNRNAQKLSRNDVMVSPRAGLTFKPTEQISLYASMSVSHLPSTGDQFSSLTATTKTLAPEMFRNREFGFKWDILPALNFSSALYKLDRNNTSAPDPLDPTRLVQTGSQRSSGFEANLTGSLSSHWQIFAGYASQKAEITKRTSASLPGATIPMVPARSVSFWSRYDFSSRIGAGMGIVAQSDMFAAIDNTVTLPGFMRTDAGFYFSPTRNLRAQLNVENLLDVKYYANSHGNNNIMPGAPRTFRISLTAY